MEQKNEKQLIYFKDLLFTALYQWKKILIFGILLALLLGAAGMLAGDKPVTVGGISMTPQIQVKVDYLESQLTRLDTAIEQHKIYMTDSVLLNQDPYSISICGYFVYVQPQYADLVEAAAPEADIAALLRAYRSSVNNDDVLVPLAQQLGMECKYLQELITFDSTSTGYLGFLAKCNDMDQAQAIADGLLQAAQASTQAISQNVHAHTVSFIPLRSTPAYENTVAEKQSAAQKTLQTYENERQYLATELAKYAPTALTAEKTSPILLAIVGGVLGVCLVVGIAWLAHLGSSKIYSARVLENRTGIRILGCVQGSAKRDPISRWLRKLEGRATHSSFEAVAVNIRNRCQDAKTLLIMGCFRPEEMTPVTTALEQAGIRCVLCSDPAVKADALQALPDSDAVVLAEVCGSSRYDSVEWAMQTVADHNKKLLGCVLIDG